VLDAAMAYAASQVNSTSAATTGAAADLSASWGLPGTLTSGPAQEHPASPAPTPQTPAPTPQPQGPASPPPPPATVSKDDTQAPAASAPIGIAGGPASLAPLGAPVLSPFDAISASMSDIFKNKGSWLKPVQPPEMLNSIFGTAEYSPTKANTPGTKAALSSLKILVRRRP
jgi:hypothetical protein